MRSLRGAALFLERSKLLDGDTNLSAELNPGEWARLREEAESWSRLKAERHIQAREAATRAAEARERAAAATTAAEAAAAEAEAVAAEAEAKDAEAKEAEAEANATSAAAKVAAVAEAASIEAAVDELGQRLSHALNASLAELPDGPPYVQMAAHLRTHASRPVEPLPEAREGAVLRANVSTYLERHAVRAALGSLALDLFRDPAVLVSDADGATVDSAIEFMASRLEAI